MEADELAVVAGFLSSDVVHVAVFVAQFAEGEDGEGGVAGWFAGGRGMGLGLGAHFVGEVGRLDGLVAALAPGGEGEVIDEVALAGGGGLEFFVVGTEKFEEAGLGFAIEEESFGEVTVFQGVSGGLGLAARGPGAGGFSGIGLVGRAFAFGDWHT